MIHRYIERKNKIKTSGFLGIIDRYIIYYSNNSIYDLIDSLRYLLWHKIMATSLTSMLYVWFVDLSIANDCERRRHGHEKK